MYIIKLYNPIRKRSHFLKIWYNETTKTYKPKIEVLLINIIIQKAKKKQAVLILLI